MKTIDVWAFNRDAQIVAKAQFLPEQDEHAAETCATLFQLAHDSYCVWIENPRTNTRRESRYVFDGQRGAWTPWVEEPLDA